MKRILITGCQRSGTTLMGLIMNSHPLIQNIDEAHFKSIDDFSTEFNSCAKLPEQSANIDFIKNEFKPDIVIWMVRNPFDVVKSMLSLHVKRSRTTTESWANTYSHMEISRVLQYLPNEYFSDYKELIHKYRLVLSQVSLRDSDHGVIIAAVTCWVLKQLGLQALRDAGINTHVVRYEDLLLNPEPVLKGICDKAGFEFHNDMLRHHEMHKGVSIGQTVNDRAIDNANIFLSGNFFNKDEISLIDKLSSKVAKLFYYPHGTGDSSFLHGKSSVDLSGDMGYFSWNLFLLESFRIHKNERRFLFYFDLLKENFSKTDFIEWFRAVEQDDWVVHLLSRNEQAALALLLCEKISSNAPNLLASLQAKFTEKNPYWKAFRCWLEGEVFAGQLNLLYKETDVDYRFAQAISGLIARQGDVLERSEQWAYLIKLDAKFPQVKSFRETAINLANTMPDTPEIRSVLEGWNKGPLSASAFRRVLFNLTPRQPINANEYSVDAFEINSIEDMYMAWRLNRAEQINVISESESELSSIASRFSRANEVDDFKGRGHFYVGDENPDKLIVVLTGLASMLMYPPALVHALVDLPAGSGVLWTQDLNARSYMTGPDGNTNPYHYEDHIVKLIREIEPKQVSIIGSSAGGSVSLHFSSVFPVYKSASLSPYTYLEMKDDSDPLQKSYASIFGGRIDLLPELGEHIAPTRVYYGAACQRDIDNAERLKDYEHINLMPIVGASGHHTGRQLALSGAYNDVFNWLLEGESPIDYWQVASA